MYCAQCGTANQDGAETCEVCGSPLAAGAGTLNCYACGSPVGEHDRFCSACGATQSAPLARAYSPGPSFNDDSDLQVDMADLPPWLQDFAKTTIDVSQMPSAPVASAAGNNSLPSWLSDDSNDNGSDMSRDTSPPTLANRPVERADSSPQNSGVNDTFSLISEDDLPEWLRALGDEEFGATAPVEPAPAPDVTTPLTRQFTTDIPTVSRAWLTQPRTRPSTGQEVTHSDFAPLQAPAPRDEPRPAVQETAQLRTAEPAVTRPSVPTAAAAPEASAQERKRRTRLLILALAVLVLLVLVVFVFSQ